MNSCEQTDLHGTLFPGTRERSGSGHPSAHKKTANSDDLRTGGSKADFDHRVDQIFTTTPKKVKKVKTWVVGRKQSYGFWHSDHAGVVGKYRLR